MNSKITRIALGVSLFAVAASAMAVPTGSYIRKPVHSVSQLVSHVRTDAVVSGRYCRHFRMTEDQVVSYLSSLHLAKLAHDGTYAVFNVHSDGVLRSRLFNLKKGTLVFADSSGRPILKQLCGNPMVWRVPTIGSDPGISEPAGPRDRDAGIGVPVEAMAEIEPTVTEPGESPVPPVAPVLPQVQTGTIRSSNGSLIPIVALGIGAAVIATRKGGHDEPPPVPEPASMLALTVGAGALVARRRRKTAN